MACPSTITCTGTRALSTRNANGRMWGDIPGRPEPTGLVVPGAHEVPAGAISRAKISRACFTGCVTETRTMTSRDAPVRAWGP